MIVETYVQQLVIIYNNADFFVPFLNFSLQIKIDVTFFYKLQQINIVTCEYFFDNFLRWIWRKFKSIGLFCFYFVSF